MFNNIQTNNYLGLNKQNRSINKNHKISIKEKVEQQSNFDKLKEAFPSINFVSGRDPLARNQNTVYLDNEAINKLENDPNYATYVFAEIETSSSIYNKGYTINRGNSTYKLHNVILWAERNFLKCFIFTFFWIYSTIK